MSTPAAAALRFARASAGVEAVTMTIGARNAQLILVATTGQWARAVLSSTGAARALCAELGIPCHDGWTDALRRRVTDWRRPPSDWARAPYPEH